MDPIDVINGNSSYGSVATRVMEANGDVNVLRTNATLRKDEWIELDTTLVQVAEERLVGVADLNANGQFITITNGLGKTVLEYEDVSAFTPATLSMDATSRSDGDAVKFTLNPIPLPVANKDFKLSIRQLMSSRNTGQSLDTTGVELATRQVVEIIEENLFNGTSSLTFAEGTIFGYTDFPSRTTVSLGVDWDASAKTGEEILADQLAMKQASIDDSHFGPWAQYIPTNYDTVLDDEFKSNSDKSIRQRLMETEGINLMKVADKLASDNVILVQRTASVARMINGMPMTTIEWQTEGNFVFHFKVITIQVPQMRVDQEGKSGLVHLS